MIRPAAGARFAPGDPVQVRDIEKEVLGAFPNPEGLAYGGDGLPDMPLYKVGFRQADLWEGYGGPPEDALFIDIYEHWLEPGEHGGEEKRP